MSKIDLDYAYGRAKLSKEASKHCVFCIIGGDFTGNYRFKKGFYAVLDIPTVIQEHFQTGETWVSRKREKYQNVQKRIEMAQLPHKPERSNADKRQN